MATISRDSVGETSFVEPEEPPSGTPEEALKTKEAKVLAERLNLSSTVSVRVSLRTRYGAI